MRKLFAKAQDPISCETHALGAVAALGGGLGDHIHVDLRI